MGWSNLPDPNLDKQEDLLKLKKSFNNTRYIARFVPERRRLTLIHRDTEEKYGIKLDFLQIQTLRGKGFELRWRWGMLNDECGLRNA